MDRRALFTRLLFTVAVASSLVVFFPAFASAQTLYVAHAADNSIGKYNGAGVQPSPDSRPLRALGVLPLIGMVIRRRRSGKLWFYSGKGEVTRRVGWVRRRILAQPTIAHCHRSRILFPIEYTGSGRTSN